MFNLSKAITLTILLLNCFNLSFADTKQVIRASKTEGNFLSILQKNGLKNAVIEFRSGDYLPVKVKMDGDFFKSIDENLTYIEVKKGFFLKIENNKLVISLDGTNYKSLSESITGMFAFYTGAEEDDNNTAQYLHFLLSANIK
jgi:hypothetical protein